MKAPVPAPKAEVAGRRSPAVGGERATPPSGRIDLGKSPFIAHSALLMGSTSAKLGLLPKKRVDLLSSSPSPPSTQTAMRVKHGGDDSDDEDDPNPGLPSASQSIVSQIPKTPPTGQSPYSLGDSDDDELEYTK